MPSDTVKTKRVTTDESHKLLWNIILVANLALVKGNRALLNTSRVCWLHIVVRLMQEVNIRLLHLKPAHYRQFRQFFAQVNTTFFVLYQQWTFAFIVLKQGFLVHLGFVRHSDQIQ